MVKAEQEALQAAIRFFEKWRHELSIEAGRKMAQVRRLAWKPDLAMLLADAHFGDRDADDVLCKLAANMLARGAILPDLLRNYVIEILRDARPKRKGRGRRLSDQHSRNLYLIMAMHMVAERGFPPTRNRESNGASASSIVAQAFNIVTNGNLDEAAVAKVWQTKFPWLSRAPYKTKPR